MQCTLPDQNHYIIKSEYIIIKFLYPNNGHEYVERCQML
jgi:hypothetical protein